MDAQISSWDGERAERSVAMLKAVADASRYRLLWALSDRELPVSSLAELIGAHVAATSQHLAKLRTAGLVTSRREGTRIYYRAAGAQVRALLECAVLAADAAAEGADVAEAEEAPVTAAQRQAVGAVAARVGRHPAPEY